MTATYDDQFFNWIFKGAWKAVLLNEYKHYPVSFMFQDLAQSELQAEDSAANFSQYTVNGLNKFIGTWKEPYNPKWGFSPALSNEKHIKEAPGNTKSLDVYLQRHHYCVSFIRQETAYFNVGLFGGSLPFDTRQRYEQITGKQIEEEFSKGKAKTEYEVQRTWSKYSDMVTIFVVNGVFQGYHQWTNPVSIVSGLYCSAQLLIFVLHGFTKKIKILPPLGKDFLMGSRCEQNQFGREASFKNYYKNLQWLSRGGLTTSALERIHMWLLAPRGVFIVAGVVLTLNVSKFWESEALNQILQFSRFLGGNNVIESHRVFSDVCEKGIKDDDADLKTIIEFQYNHIFDQISSVDYISMTMATVAIIQNFFATKSAIASPLFALAIVPIGAKKAKSVFAEFQMKKVFKIRSGSKAKDYMTDSFNQDTASVPDPQVPQDVTVKIENTLLWRMEKALNEKGKIFVNGYTITQFTKIREEPSNRTEFAKLIVKGLKLLEANEQRASDANEANCRKAVMDHFHKFWDSTGDTLTLKYELVEQMIRTNTESNGTNSPFKTITSVLLYRNGENDQYLGIVALLTPSTTGAESIPHLLWLPLDDNVSAVNAALTQAFENKKEFEDKSGEIRDKTFRQNADITIERTTNIGREYTEPLRLVKDAANGQPSIKLPYNLAVTKELKSSGSGEHVETNQKTFKEYVSFDLSPLLDMNSAQAVLFQMYYQSQKDNFDQTFETDDGLKASLNDLKASLIEEYEKEESTDANSFYSKLAIDVNSALIEQNWWLDYCTMAE